MTRHTHCFKGLGRVPHIIFWGHHKGQTSSLDRWQLSNPPDLPCLPCTHLVINTGILLVNIRQAWGYTRSSCPHKWNPDTKKTSFYSRSILIVRIISYYRGWPVRVSYTLVKNIGNVSCNIERCSQNSIYRFVILSVGKKGFRHGWLKFCDTVKPVCNDQLYIKIFFLWLIQ